MGIDPERAGHGPGAAHGAGACAPLVEQAVEQGTIAKTNEQILTSAFDFGDLRVRQIMNAPDAGGLPCFWASPSGTCSGRCRRAHIPGCPSATEDIDHVVGFVHMKDLFNHLALIPGRLRFTDEKSPAAKQSRSPMGCRIRVHVIGSGTSISRRSSGRSCTCRRPRRRRRSCGNSRRGRCTWRWWWTNMERRRGS